MSNLKLYIIVHFKMILTCLKIEIPIKAFELIVSFINFIIGQFTL